MQTGVIELYGADYLEKQRKRNRTRMILLLAIIAAGLTACIILCCGVNTANSKTRMFWVMGISTVTGWIAIYLYVFGYRAMKREIAHGEHLADGERTCVSGRVELAKKAIRIRNSVQIRKVDIETAEGTVHANINDARSEELRRAGNPLKLWLSHGYVTAYEVEHEIL